MTATLEDLVPFVHAAEAGSFALAATRLGVTRSAVGKAIARLEARLGVRLFQRTTRKLSLTREGERYAERCRNALSELAAGENEARSGRHAPEGVLRVTVPVILGRVCIAPVLTAWAAKHPAVRLEITFTDRVVDLVDEGFDLGVRIGPLLDTTSLVARALGQQHMVLCAAPSYLRRHARPRTIDDLTAHDAVVYRQGGVTFPWALRGGDGVDRVIKPRARVAMDDVSAIVDAAVRGMGIARLPRWLLATAVADRQLVVLFDEASVVSSDIHVVRPAGPFVPQRTRSAIDALLAEVPALLTRRDSVARRRVKGVTATEKSALSRGGRSGGKAPGAPAGRGPASATTRSSSSRRPRPRAR